MQRLLFTLTFIALLYPGIGAYAQSTEIPTHMVTGHIYDATSGKVIEGIGITVENFASVITDSLGAYSIAVPNKDAVLIISGLNYQTTEAAVKGRGEIDAFLYEKGHLNFYSTINLALKSDKNAYTTQSVSTLNQTETAWRTPGISGEKAWEGKISGLRVIPRSGNPGLGSNMFLRGFSSLYATNQPLIVVDGMIYDNESYGTSIISGYQTNPLADITINDIEDISIVKDAASIYGAKAANGVIFITTTHAYNVATKIELSSYGGLSYQPDRIPVLNAEQYRPLLNELILSAGVPGNTIAEFPFMMDDPGNTDYYRYHNDENWQNKIFENSYAENFNLKITGGDDIALYALSVGYLNHGGIVKNTGFSRLTMRFNSDINITKKLTFNANIGITNAQRDLMPDGLNFYTNPYLLSLIKAPFLYERVINEDGIITPVFEDADIFEVSNPVALTENMTAGNRNYRIFGSMKMNYQFNDHFTVSNLVGVNFGKLRDNLFVPHLGVPNIESDLGTLYNEMGHRVEQLYAITNDFKIDYKTQINYKHGIKAFAGWRIASYKTQEDLGLGFNSPNDEMRSVGTGNILLRKVGGYIGNWNWMTFYASAEYNYLQKYFLSVSASLDGSSRFGDKAEGLKLFSHSFGVFPSVSGGWLISSERFMAEIKKIDLLKLRLSYGLTGNDDIGNYTTKSYYTTQPFLGAWGLVIGDIGNPELQWETNTKLNFGIDLSAFKERLLVNLDLFHNTTRDMLNYEPLNIGTGFDYMITNFGSFNSNGVDLNIHGRIINKEIKWDMGLILSKYVTEVTEITGGEVLNYVGNAGILTKEGQPLTQFYGYKTTGVYATSEDATNAGLSALIDNTQLIPFEAGDVIFEDLDGNKIIDERDMQVIGNPNPDFTGMITTAVSWKNFTLDAALAFCYGNDIYNYTRYTLESIQNWNNQTTAVLNRWRVEGQQTTMPKARYGDPVENARFSDRWIEDGSFARLKNVTLTYNIPVRKIPLNNAEIFISGQNLFTMTKYKGLDPEFSASGSTFAQGIDVGLTPQPRAVFFGVKLGL